jgi:hypothetical protein
LVRSTTKIGVEVDGAQHYVYSSLFHGSKGSFDDQVNRDLKKDILCKKKGIALVRVDCRKKITKGLVASMVGEAARAELEEVLDEGRKSRELRRKEYIDSFKLFRKKIRKEQTARLKEIKKSGGN